ncbi:MAG TPA: hypothetical protein VGB51_04850 [Actinomycetota bacterium]
MYAPHHRALFTGDAMWQMGPLRPSWGPFTADPDRNLESIRELAGLPSEAVCLGNGAPVCRDGQARLPALVR